VNIVDTKTYRIDLNREEYMTIKNCLDYASHRLRKHIPCGLTGLVPLEKVDTLRKQMEGK